MELEKGLPNKQKFEIERWPAENGLTTGFDLAEPDGRRTVLTELVKIRESLLQKTKRKTNSCRNNVMGYLVVLVNSLACFISPIYYNKELLL